LAEGVFDRQQVFVIRMQTNRTLPGMYPRSFSIRSRLDCAPVEAMSELKSWRSSAAAMTRSRSESSLKSDFLSVKTGIASLTALMFYG
jgi:hypothetical protein